MGASKPAKDLGTVRHRQIHFMWFLQQLKLLHHVFPVVTLDTEALNYSMAMYAVHLGTGNTILGKTIKAATVAHYVYNAATFVQIFDEANRDPRKTDGTTTTAPCLKKVLAELERWEDLPDRKEPYTVAMHKLLVERSTTSSRDGITGGLRSWFGAMLQAGGRLGEWANPRGHSRLLSADRNIRGDVRAFTLHDVVFMGQGKRRMTHLQALSHPTSARFVEYTLRTQKNGDHGEKKLCTTNTVDSDLDAVANWLAIVGRFYRLCGDRNDIPLSVYWNPLRHEVRLITAAEIETVMRSLAAEVYNFDPLVDHEALSKFTSHSLRIGACVILQALGFQGHEIKKLLRWKSNAFMTYLRNLVILSERQNQALAAAAHLPHL